MIKRLVTVSAFLLFLLTPEGTTLAVPKDSPWGANYFPNVPLVTQEGKTVLLYDDLIKDKKVLINFIYSGCEKACPLATAKLAQVQKLLGDRVGRDIFIYSITLDPEHDTPEALKAYAEKYGAGPGWLFLTGKPEDIYIVRMKLGERREDKEEHQNIVRVGNGTIGQWMKLPLFGDINFLVNEIGKTLDPNWYKGKSLKGYAEAPRFEMPKEGQVLFRNRCAVCHTIGKGELRGPDLKGVTTRRERAWLARFIADPDRMRAKKDPIAIELYAKYKNMPMPNIGLTKAEVGDLISYLEDRNNDLEGKEGGSLSADP